MQTFISLVVIVAGIVAALYSGTPHLAFYQANAVVESRNQAAIKNMLQEHVDFAAVKSDVRGILARLVKQKISETTEELKDNPFRGLASGIAMIFAPALIDPLVEEITPDAIASKLSEFSSLHSTNCKIQLVSFGAAQYVCTSSSGVMISLWAESAIFNWKIKGISVVNEQQFFKDLKTLQ